MSASTISLKTRTIASLGVIVALGFWSIASAAGAQAATVLSGPIDLGTASTYGVLAASAVTNTGPTVVNGDLGVSPQSSITGFGGLPNGDVVGVVHDSDAEATLAQLDVTTAFNTAAGLTPTTSGLTEMNGMSLTPGVYSGGALSLANNGTLTLAGTSADSVWVFQAASSLTIGSATQIIITGGASACNVFWEVGSSATIGTTAHFQGTVLASASISAATGATIAGRLLARTAAVTLQSNIITAPLGCSPGSPPTTTDSPEITSGAPVVAVVGTPYSFDITATGSPAPVLSMSGGSLPAGLAFDSSTGVVSGTPLAAGRSSFTITASNGLGPDVNAIITITAARPALALTGVNPFPGLLIAGLLFSAGVVLIGARRSISYSTKRS